MAEKEKKKRKPPKRVHKPLTEDSPITAKESKFIDYYIETGNGKQSLLKAGYNVSENSASSYANRLLKKVNVQKILRDRMQELRTPRIASAQQVMEYFTQVMNGEIKDQFGLEASLADRTRAAMELAKRTVDIENRRTGEADAKVQIVLDWGGMDD